MELHSIIMALVVVGVFSSSALASNLDRNLYWSGYFDGSFDPLLHTSPLLINYSV
jgi:hypothetical protein